jgi:spoIIIJ-associated protein
VSQRDNAVAEPSESARDQDAGERETGERDADELTGAEVAYSPAGEPGGAAASDPAAAAAASAETGPAGSSDTYAVPAPLGSASDAGTAVELGGEVIDRGDGGAGGGDDDLGGDDLDEDDEDGDLSVAGARAAAGPRDEDGSDDVADLELEGEIAADYVEGLLDVADLDGDIDMDVEGDRALVSVVGATLDELVGPRGEVLEALQELTRLAVHRQTGVRTRIMLDVGGYRLRRRAELAEAGREAAEEVKQTGMPKKMWAMNRFERKVVHDAVAAAGLRSESEGDEPDRKVVVLPAD